MKSILYGIILMVAISAIAVGVVEYLGETSVSSSSKTSVRLSDG